MSVAEPTPNIDPNAVPVAAPAAPPAAPEPTVAAHDETGTTLLTYTATGLNADLVVAYARAAGHDIIGLPDQIDTDTWRVQVATPAVPPAPAPTVSKKKG